MNELAPVAWGTTIAVTSSSGARAVVIRPVKNASSGIERVPPGPVASTTPSSARSAVATSPPRGGENRLPPTVAMLRTVQLAVRRAAVARIGTASCSASAVSVVIAPIRSPPSRGSIPSIPARRRPITRVGRMTPSLTSGIAIVPPARTSRSGPCAPSSPTASATDVGRT